MICKECGQEIKARTYYDLMKECLIRNPEEYFDELAGALCQHGCPFDNICSDTTIKCIFIQLSSFMNKEINAVP